MDSFDWERMQREKRADDMKWDLRHKQIDDLKQSWRRQDMEDAERERRTRDLSLNMPSVGQPPLTGNPLIDSDAVTKHRQAEDMKWRFRHKQEKDMRDGWLQQDLKENREKEKWDRLDNNLF